MKPNAHISARQLLANDVTVLPLKFGLLDYATRQAVTARLARQVERILRADYCPRCGCAVGTWGQCRNYGCEQVHMRRPKPAENKKRKAVKN